MTKRSMRTKLDRQRVFPGDNAVAGATTFFIFLAGFWFQGIFLWKSGWQDTFLRNTLFILIFGAIASLHGILWVASVSKRKRASKIDEATYKTE